MSHKKIVNAKGTPLGAEQFTGPRRQLNRNVAKSPTNNPVNRVYWI